MILAVIFQTVNYLAFVKHEIAALVCPWECQLCKHQIYFFLVNTTEPILNGLLVTLWDGIPYHTIWHKKSSFQDSPTTSNRNRIVIITNMSVLNHLMVFFIITCLKIKFWFYFSIRLSLAKVRLIIRLADLRKQILICTSY